MRERCTAAVRSIVILVTAGLALVSCSSKGSGDDAQVNAQAQSAAPPPPPPPVQAPAVYTMNLGSEGGPNLVLTRVTVDAKATTLEMTMTNRGRGEFTMAVSDAGTDHSMFLQLPGGKKVNFRSATGIEVNPVRTKIKPKESKSFTLVFDAIDPSVRSFDVFEGEDAKDPIKKKKKNLWVWRNVELK